VAVEDLQTASAASVDQAAMTARVYADAERVFGGQAPAVVLERCAHDAVADLWVEGIRITSFVPVLALRHVRDMLRSTQPPAVDIQVQTETDAPQAVYAGATTAAGRGLTDVDVLTDRDTLTPD
jgi:hypothetical protein